MANVFSIIPYQINSSPAITTGNAQQIALPTTGVTVQDITNSPTRSLSTGVNVYTLITLIGTGTKYYVSSTYATIIAAIG
mgnify:CR=1 FL=1